MFRYVALAWNAADRSAANAASEFLERLDISGEKWHRVMRRPGIEVRCVPNSRGASHAYAMPGERGAVLGTLFLRASDQASRPVNGELSERDADAIVTSRGRKLVESFWGRYVAFFHDTTTGTSWVLRDPTAGMPCFSCSVRGVTIYFAELEDAIQIGARPFSINWDYFARSLCLPAGLQTHETALEEVDQVLGGECVEWNAGRAMRKTLWDPWAIAAEPLEDPVAAAAAVRSTTVDVVHGWARALESVLHGLGGLDSAIVCTCLATAPSRPRITCYTYYSEGANSDERSFGRLVAARAGVELLEVERTPLLNLEPLLQSMRCSPNPGNHASYIEPAFVEGNLARQSGATAITSGYGGDQLFVQCHPNGAVDRVVKRGIGRTCWSRALDDACMEGGSVWTVLKDVVRATVFRRFGNPLAPIDGTRSLVPDQILRSTKNNLEALHPHIRRWVTEPVYRKRGHLAFASGKVSQVQQLLYPPVMQNPLAAPDVPEHVAPLFSQPLLELCIRIPTWVHTDGGQERAIARRAFRDQLPREVVNRWTKGGWEEQAAGLLRHNIRFVRGLLMDGELEERGLLIRSRVEEWLSYRPTRLPVSNVEIFHLVFAEAWLRKMMALRSQASRKA